VRASPRAGSAAAAALALAVLAIAWAGLYEGVGWPRVAALCAVAALPAVATCASRARGPLAAAAAIVAVPVVLAMALRHSVWDYVTLDGAAWLDARAVIPDGLRTASNSGLPVSAAEHPELVALLDLALAALAATIAWQILARRRPVAGLVASAWGCLPLTVEPRRPASPWGCWRSRPWPRSGARLPGRRRRLAGGAPRRGRPRAGRGGGGDRRRVGRRAR
jgi:hypothetical protein